MIPGTSFEVSRDTLDNPPIKKTDPFTHTGEDYQSIP
jgi:hypothetical protein